MTKNLLLICLGFYLGIGLFFGLMLTLIPATTTFAMAYAGLTWPLQVICSTTGLLCDAAIPSELSHLFFEF